MAKNDSMLVRAHCVSMHSVLCPISCEESDLKVQVWQSVTLVKFGYCLAKYDMHRGHLKT